MQEKEDVAIQQQQSERKIRQQEALKDEQQKSKRGQRAVDNFMVSPKELIMYIITQSTEKLFSFQEQITIFARIQSPQNMNRKITLTFILQLLSDAQRYKENNSKLASKLHHYFFSFLLFSLLVFAIDFWNRFICSDEEIRIWKILIQIVALWVYLFLYIKISYRKSGEWNSESNEEIVFNNNNFTEKISNFDKMFLSEETQRKKFTETISKCEFQTLVEFKYWMRIWMSQSENQTLVPFIQIQNVRIKIQKQTQFFIEGPELKRILKIIAFLFAIYLAALLDEINQQPNEHSKLDKLCLIITAATIICSLLLEIKKKLYNI